jgi:hypothetical protein
MAGLESLTYLQVSFSRLLPPSEVNERRQKEHFFPPPCRKKALSPFGKRWSHLEKVEVHWARPAPSTNTY